MQAQRGMARFVPSLRRHYPDQVLRVTAANCGISANLGAIYRTLGSPRNGDESKKKRDACQTSAKQFTCGDGYLKDLTAVFRAPLGCLIR